MNFNLIEVVVIVAVGVIVINRLPDILAWIQQFIPSGNKGGNGAGGGGAMLPTVILTPTQSKVHLIGNMMTGAKQLTDKTERSRVRADIASMFASLLVSELPDDIPPR